MEVKGAHGDILLWEYGDGVQIYIQIDSHLTGFQELRRLLSHPGTLRRGHSSLPKAVKGQ